MEVKAVFQADRITDLAKKRFQEERALNHLEGWFLAKEIQRECDEKYKNEEDCIRIAKTQVEVMKRIPLTLGEYHVFAGTQDDSFARSYALINPALRWILFAVIVIRWQCLATLIQSEILQRRELRVLESTITRQNLRMRLEKRMTLPEIVPAKRFSLSSR